jgi:hypothetical protein
MKIVDAVVLLVVGVLLLPLVVMAGLLVGIWVGFVSAAGL